MKKTISVLIKPAADRCNMRCTYCFYAQEAALRAHENSLMPLETIQIIVRKVLSAADGGDVFFVFQGGEPLLAGLSFFEEAVHTAQQYNTRGSRVYFSVQTNGTLITDAFAAFFARHGFLVGVSLDGTKETHDAHRRMADDTGTFDTVLRGIDLLKKHGAQYNILTVVTNEIADNIDAVYAFYQKQGYNFLQFIPYLPQKRESLADKQVLHPQKFTDFLIGVYDLWKAEVLSGRYRSVAHLDQIGSFLLGYPYTSCNTRGLCANQLVIEADGSVYPCDFYAGDAHCMGNILKDALPALLSNRIEKAWREAAQHKRENCASCAYFAVCRGGCARYFAEDKHIYCESYQKFFNERLQDFRQTVRKIQL